MLIRKILYTTIFILLLSGVLSYGLYKALPVLLGPNIQISTPQDGDILTEDMVSMRGTVSRTQKLFVNGVATGFSKEGLFETILPLYDGNNIVNITAIDRFNRPITVTLTLGNK